jgi:hypothetical protein
MMLSLVSFAHAGWFAAPPVTVELSLPPDGSQPPLSVPVDGIEPVEGVPCTCTIEALSCGADERDGGRLRLQYDGERDRIRTAAGVIDRCTVGDASFEVSIGFRMPAMGTPWIAGDVIVWPVHETAGDSVWASQFVPFDIPEGAVFPETSPEGDWPPAACTRAPRGGLRLFKAGGTMLDESLCFTHGDREVRLRFLPYGSP